METLTRTARVAVRTRLQLLVNVSSLEDISRVLYHEALVSLTEESAKVHTLQVLIVGLSPGHIPVKIPDARMDHQMQKQPRRSPKIKHCCKASCGSGAPARHTAYAGLGPKIKPTTYTPFTEFR
jgi:hypothetical protein